ncbi:hypothetical protein AQUCO_03500144v1 [Aquilegia coerulea]|uniref:Uncharacterized protein n=1 Tax=Aquilegia coerulea TaxID=218851 RepID=A0A2G5CWD2_AQUCA|nr:hypothetical protein AQUCO_03500144v1 [Aquilegia coerulea]
MGIGVSKKIGKPRNRTEPNRTGYRSTLFYVVLWFFCLLSLLLPWSTRSILDRKVYLAFSDSHMDRLLGYVLNVAFNNILVKLWFQSYSCSLASNTNSHHGNMFQKVSPVFLLEKVSQVEVNCRDGAIYRFLHFLVILCKVFFG